MNSVEIYRSGGGAVFYRTARRFFSKNPISERLEFTSKRHETVRAEAYFEIYDEMLKSFRGRGFKPRERLYEFGVGPGALALEFQRSGLAIIGTDIKDLRTFPFSNLAFARNYFPFPDGVFDYVSATSVLHHIPASEHPLYAEEFKRILKPKGVILVQEDEKGRNAAENLAIRTVDRLVSGPEANSHRNLREWIEFFEDKKLIVRSRKIISFQKGPARLRKIFFALTRT